jgi:hypothetical protein
LSPLETAKAQYLYSKVLLILEFESLLSEDERENDEYFPEYLQVLKPVGGDVNANADGSWDGKLNSLKTFAKEENEKMEKKMDSMKEQNETLEKKMDSMKAQNDELKVILMMLVGTSKSSGIVRDSLLGQPETTKKGKTLSVADLAKTGGGERESAKDAINFL